MDLSRFEKIEDQKVTLTSIEEIDKSEIYYFDAEGKATDKSHAATAIIRDLDKNGNLIRETYGSIEQSQEKQVDSKKKDEEFRLNILFL